MHLCVLNITELLFCMIMFSSPDDLPTTVEQKDQDYVSDSSSDISDVMTNRFHLVALEMDQMDLVTNDNMAPVSTICCLSTNTH